MSAAELRRARTFLLEAQIADDERAIVIFPNGPLPQTILRGRFTGDRAGVQHQRCGGGHRILKKRIGGS